MHEGVAQGARDLVVDFDDHVAGVLDHRVRDIDAGAQTQVAVPVGGRALQQGNVDG